MSLGDFLTLAAQALALLSAFPFHWLAVLSVFLVAVESLMFVPYVGFTLKLTVAGIVSAQVLALFKACAAGSAPSALALASAFSLPPSAQVVLALAAVLPFLAGVVYLYLRGGRPAIRFFFGNVFRDRPPAGQLFLHFKIIMQLAALPLLLLPGAVILMGLSGWSAVSATFGALASSWLPVVGLGLLSLGFEWLSASLPSLLPKPVVVVASIVLLFAFLAFAFAMTYTVSARAFGVP
jgi:hypothetical protein